MSQNEQAAQNASLAGKSEGGTGTNEPRIVRGRVDSLSLYEITDHELDILEKGSPNSIYLNFSIFLLSVGASFSATLLTTEIQSDRIFDFFVIICAVGIFGGFFLLLVWYRMKSELTDVVKRIKGRISAAETPSAVRGIKGIRLTTPRQQSTRGILRNVRVYSLGSV